ncbi:hypothetical protein K3G63_09235 [Hymenobacter sp. HSC-4F20]|uniref:hypothetical protein n=1 Tax=Hymenobacter sp. HSC-4F20 TaxID=2864135 RepID=UPI001C73590B|nr:hypothetical protein [Hymenobacter sp. HSC-4F20]MBX0290619.1 hypothetical protein [Hymenobacter sp. HSC-4F20]
MGGRQQLTPGQRAAIQAQRLTKQLRLSAEQTAQVRTIALAQERQALRAQSAAPGNGSGRGQELKALQDKHDTQLKAVLTADQYATYDHLRDDKRDNPKQRKAGAGKMKAPAKS